MILRYVPPIKSSLKVTVLIGFLINALFLYILFIQFGFVVIIIYSFIYAAFILTSFISLSSRHFIELEKESEKIVIHTLLSYIEIPIQDIAIVDIVEKKNSYLLSIETKESKEHFSLSGSLSFEEPQLFPFIRKLHELKPTIGFGDLCIEMLHGKSSFNPWSAKMYYSYWTYMGMMIGYYLFLLLFLQIFKG